MGADDAGLFSLFNTHFPVHGGKDFYVSCFHVLNAETGNVCDFHRRFFQNPNKFFCCVRATSFRALLCFVAQRKGMVIKMKKSSMADVARLSDKILVIDSGHLVVCGTPKEVFSQTEELEKVGLDLPPITRLTEELRKRGMKIEPTILSIDEAAGQIAEYLKARGNG